MDTVAMDPREQHYQIVNPWEHIVRPGMTLGQILEWLYGELVLEMMRHALDGSLNDWAMMHLTGQELNIEPWKLLTPFGGDAESGEEEERDDDASWTPPTWDASGIDDWLREKQPSAPNSMVSVFIHTLESYTDEDGRFDEALWRVPTAEQIVALYSNISTETHSISTLSLYGEPSLMLMNPSIRRAYPFESSSSHDEHGSGVDDALIRDANRAMAISQLWKLFSHVTPQIIPGLCRGESSPLPRNLLLPVRVSGKRPEEMPKCIRQAIDSYTTAVKRVSKLKNAKLPEVYKWVQENSKYDGLPSYDTWSRYIREAKKEGALE